MTPATIRLLATSPDNPVRKALADPETQKELCNHALAILGRFLIHRPAADRVDKAKEACQETCARALQRVGEHDSARPVRPWLHGIMNNVLLESSRALRRSPGQEVPDTAAW